MSKYFFVIAFVGVLLLAAFARMPAKADSAMDASLWMPCNQIPYCGLQTSGHIENTWKAPASPTPTPTSFPSNAPGEMQTSSLSITADVTANGTDFGHTTIKFGDPTVPAVESIPAVESEGFGIPALHIGGSGIAPSTRPDSSPTFIPGSYVMVGSDLPSPQVGTRPISSAPHPHPGATDTPEPSTLLQTGAGLLLGLGVIVFWRKQSFRAARS